MWTHAAGRAVLVIALAMSHAVAAQVEPPRVVREAAPTFAPSDIARHLAALATDSATDSTSTIKPMRARLDVGARYVAEQFGTLGLRAGFQPEGLWFQEYPIPGGRTFDYDSIPLSIGTFVRRDGAEVLAERGYEVGKEIRLSMVTAAPLVRGDVAEENNGLHLGFEPSRPLVVAGPHTPASAGRLPVRGKVVFFVRPAGLDSIVERQVVDTLARGSKGVVVMTDEDSVRFAARQRSVRRPLPLIDSYMKLAKGGTSWVAYVRSDSLAHLFTLAGVDLAELRRVRTPVAREALPLSAWFWVRSGGFGPDAQPAGANVIGLLEGSDPLVNRQYVVVAAHLNPADAPERADDSSGSRAPAAVRQDAAHDASGVAALLAVARAFAEAGTRPRRSILFVATSGVDYEFAGAEFLASVVVPRKARAPTRAVASLTLDLIGGHAGDSVTVDGLDEIDFGTLRNWVTSAHGDVGLTIVSGSILSAPCADQCAFVRRKVPSLYFHDPNASHDRGQSTRTGSAVPDVVHGARVARLTIDLVRAIADAERAPRWQAGALEQFRQRGAGD